MKRMKRITSQYLTLTSCVAVLGWMLILFATVSVFVLIPFVGASPFLVSIALLATVGLLYAILAFNARCPTCQGYVFVEKLGPKHPAVRQRKYMNHWATVVIDILSAKAFTCMYCGTRTHLSEL